MLSYWKQKQNKIYQEKLAKLTIVITFALIILSGFTN